MASQERTWFYSTAALFLGSCSIATLIATLAGVAASLIFPEFEEASPFIFIYMAFMIFSSPNFIFFFPYSSLVLLALLWFFCMSYFKASEKAKLREQIKNLVALLAVASLTPFTYTVTLLAWPVVLAFGAAILIMNIPRLRKFLTAG